MFIIYIETVLASASLIRIGVPFLMITKLFPSSITVYAYGRIKHIKYKHTWCLAICRILLLEINLGEFARRKIHAEHLLEAAILFRT